jgi:cardiolipin synthase
MMNKQNIPNWLTYGRYVAVPLLLFAWYLPYPWGNWLPLMIMLAACATDFFDGYLARKWNAQSELGRLLDPNADKLLIATALVLLASETIASPVAVALILCRELFISGLREFMAQKQIVIHVTKLAKWKTTTQMVAVLLLLIGHGIGMGLFIADMFLWLATALTLWTGWEYSFPVFKFLRNPN